jgi:hypothetical protein
MIIGNAGALLQGNDVHSVSFHGSDCLIRSPARLANEIGALFAQAATPLVERQQLFRWICPSYFIEQIQKNFIVNFAGSQHPFKVEIAFNGMDGLKKQSPPELQDSLLQCADSADNRRPHPTGVVLTAGIFFTSLSKILMKLDLRNIQNGCMRRFGFQSDCDQSLAVNHGRLFRWDTDTRGTYYSIRVHSRATVSEKENSIVATSYKRRIPAQPSS